MLDTMGGMKYWKWIAGLFVVFSLVVIPFGVRLVTEERPLGTAASAKRGEGLYVFLSPNEVYTTPGGEVEILIKIDTGKEVVGGVEGTLVYDTRSLVISGDVVASSAFSNLSSSVGSGKISFSGKGRLAGEGRIASVRFRGRRIGSSVVRLDSVSVLDVTGGKSGIQMEASGGVKVVVE